jgi:hypothetical protein
VTSALLYVLLLAGSAEAVPKAKPSGVDVSARMKELTADYATVADKLEKLKNRQQAAEAVGTPLKVHKDIAKDIFVEQKRLDILDERLKQVLDHLRAPPSELGAFKIVITRDKVGGVPLTSPVINGDILAFSADVPHPAADPPLLTELFWQLYDAKDNAVPGVHKQDQAVKAGGHAKYSFRFRLNNLKNGRYKLGLTHRLMEDPSVSAQAVVPFSVFQEVSITRIVVTADPKDQSGRRTLHGDERPYFYAYYELVDKVASVEVQMEIRNRQTGRVITTKSAQRDRKQGKLQRVGFALKKDSIKVGTSAEIIVTVTPPSGQATSATQAFSVANYSLAFRLPSTLNSGKSQTFSIKPPKSFTPPYKVDIPPVRGLSFGHRPGQLKGTVTGIGTRDERSVRFYAVVTDAKGRVASGSKVVSITALAPSPRDKVSRKPTTKRLKSTARKPASNPRKKKTSRGPSAAQRQTAKEAQWAAKGRQRLKQLRLDSNALFDSIGCWSTHKPLDDMMQTMERRFVSSIDSMLQNRKKLISVGSESASSWRSTRRDSILRPVGREVAKGISYTVPGACTDRILQRWKGRGLMSASLVAQTREKQRKNKADSHRKKQRNSTRGGSSNRSSCLTHVQVNFTKVHSGYSDGVEQVVCSAGTQKGKRFRLKFREEHGTRKRMYQNGTRTQTGRALCGCTP